MHKCIMMVKPGGKRKNLKYVKTRKFYENRGKILKVGGNNNFREIGGKCIEIAKIGGKFKI